ncbi:hypothetical protein V1264_014675 [Littorina saxatilis]
MACVYGARTANNTAAIMEQQVKRNLPTLSRILDPEQLFLNITHVLHDFDVQKIEKSLKLDYADPMLVVRIYTVLKRRENWTTVFIQALTIMREYEALRLLGIDHTEPQPEENIRSEKHPTVCAQPIADRSFPQQMIPSFGQSSYPCYSSPHLSQAPKGNIPSSLESSQPSNLSFSCTPSDNSYLPIVGQKGAMVNPHLLNNGRLYSCEESMVHISQTGTHGRVGNERGVSLPNAGLGRPQANVRPDRLQSYAGPGIPKSAQQSGVTMQDLANNFKQSLLYPAYPHKHPSDGPIQTEQRCCERGRHMDQPNTTNGTSDPGPITSFAPTGTLPTTSQVHPRDFSPNIVQSIDDNMDSGLASEDFPRRSMEQKEDNIGNNLSEERSRQGKTNSTADMKTSDGELQTDTDLLTDDAQPEQEEDGVSEAAERGRAHNVRQPSISQVRSSHLPSECQWPHSPPVVHIIIHKLIANVAQFSQDGHVNMSAQETHAHPTPGPVPQEEGRSRLQAESCSAQRLAYPRTSDPNTPSTPSHPPSSNPRQDTAIKTVRESPTVGNRAPSGSERESLLQQETQQEGLTEQSGFTRRSDLSALTAYHQTQLKMGWEREEVGLTSRDRQPNAQMPGERTETRPEQYQLQSSPDLSTFCSAPAYHETEPKVISDDEDDDEKVPYHERTDYTMLDTRLTKSNQAKADSHETYPKKRSLQETDVTYVKECDRRQTRNMSDWQRETTLAYETEPQETKAAECDIHQSHPNTCSQEEYKTADHQTTPKEILDEEYDYHQNQKGDGWTQETDIFYEAQTANNAESGDAEMYHKIGLLKSTKNAENQTDLQRRRATENSALEQAPTNQQTQFQMYSHGSPASTTGAKTEGRSRENDGVNVFDQMKETAGWQTKHLQKNGGQIAKETLQPVQRRDPSSGIYGRNPTVASLGVEESSSPSQAGPRNPTKPTQFGKTGDPMQGNIPAVILVPTRAPFPPSSSSLSPADFEPRPLLGPDSLDRLERQENAVLELPSFEISLEASGVEDGCEDDPVAQQG